jgi:lia operon protein LiaG
MMPAIACVTRAHSSPFGARAARVPARPLAAMLLAAALAGAPAGAMAQAGERHVLGAGDAAVHNLAGQVRLLPAAGEHVEVRLARGGADAGRLRVETGAVGGTQTLRVIYPSAEVVYPALGRRSSTSLRVRRDGTLGEGGDRVRIRGSGSGLEAWADLEIHVPAGAVIALHLGVGRVEATNIDGDLTIRSSSAPVTVEGGRGSLRAGVGSGSLAVRSRAGDAHLSTGSGALRAEALAGNELRMSTGSGGITVAELEADQVQLNTGSGTIRAAGLHAGEARLRTGSGGVQAELRTAFRALEVRTGSGSVRLRIPAATGADVDIQTGSGGIRTDLPVMVRQTSRSRLVGRMGEGGARLLVRTGSGSVTIQEL